jgi:hypothetical protein
MGITGLFRLHAQGEFLERGESGFGAGVIGVYNKESDYLGTAIGYSYKGRVDLGLSYGVNFLDSRAWGPSATRSGWGPYATLHLVKASEDFPVSFTAFGAMSFYNYSGNDSSYTQRITESFASSLGMSMYFVVPLGSKLRIVPINEFGFSRSSIYFLDDDGREVNNKDDSFFWNVSIPFVYRFNSGLQLRISPSFISADTRYYYGLGIGVIIGGSPYPASSRRSEFQEMPQYLQSPGW